MPFLPPKPLHHLAPLWISKCLNFCFTATKRISSTSQSRSWRRLRMACASGVIISYLSHQLPSPNSVGTWFTNSPTSGHPEWDSSCFSACWSSSWIAFNGSPRIEAAATAAIVSLGRQVSVILVVISGYASSMATNVSESSGGSYEKERHPTIQPSNHPSQHLPRVFSASSWSQIWSVSAISRKYFKALDALVTIESLVLVTTGDLLNPEEPTPYIPEEKNTQTSRVQVTILGFGISSRNSLRKSWQVLSSNLPTSILCTGAFRCFSWLSQLKDLECNHVYHNPHSFLAS